MNAELPLNSSSPVPPAADLLPRARRLPSRTTCLLRQLAQCAAVAAVAFASYFLVSRFFLQSVQVVGASMHPTLQNSERYLLNRWIVRVRAPRPGEIVVLRDPADHGFSVKRVIATPGDRVLVANGQVQVNGVVLPEPYLPKGTKTYPDGSGRQQTLVCGQNEYIVLGDNRMNSADSRAYGPVPRKAVLGLIIR